MAGLKSDAAELYIDELEAVSDDWNKLESKVNNINVDDLRLFHLTLKKLADTVDKSVQNIMHFQLVTKVNGTEVNIPGATSLIAKSQYDADK